MKNSNYYAEEQEREQKFLTEGPFYHANTPEDYPVIFTNDNDYRDAMSILALTAMSFPKVNVYAFQLMSNHIHLLSSGQLSDIQDFLDYFIARLKKHFCEAVDIKTFQFKLFHIHNLDYLRNAIAYVNRNGFVVNDNATPFSYPWGTSAYFFQPLLRDYEKVSGTAIGTKRIRELMHSRYFDNYKDVNETGGYISPAVYCRISEAEQLFRNARQYFYYTSRNVEAHSEIAKTIGEALCYTDNDLCYIATKLAKRDYGADKILELNAAQKMTIAKLLHYEYNASDKQLQRVLKIPQDLLKSLF